MQAAVYELKDRDGNVDKLHVLKHKHKGEHPLRVQSACSRYLWAACMYLWRKLALVMM